MSKEPHFSTISGNKVSQRIARISAFVIIKNVSVASSALTTGYSSIKYGAILHEGKNRTSTCQEYLKDGSIVQTRTANVFPGEGTEGVSSVTVFVQPNEPPDPTKGGVTLYKLENYSEEQVQSGGTAKKVFYNFPYSSDLNKYKDLSQYFYDDGKSVEDRVLSLKIDGNYLALLFKNPNFQHNCEVVAANDFNLGVDNPVGKEVSSLKVIPAQK